MQGRKKKAIFRFFLIGFSVLLMLLSSGVIQGGVTSSVIPASNPGVQQCGGGSCPIPTETATSVCNPYNWYYYDSEYAVKIISAQADKSEYRPGDVVTITGTVQLARQDYYANECGEVGSVEPVADDAGKVKVAITGPYDGTINNAGGSLTGNVNLPTTAGASTVTYTVTATYSSASDQRDVSFDVIEFTPSLSVVMSQGSFVYPGETITVSGSSWAPDGTVTLDYGALGSGATVAVDGSGAFTAPALTVASDQSEGSYPIKGTESPNLESSGTATVQWRQLKLSLIVSSPSVQEGSSVTVSGTVTDNEGKPVQGASVSFSGGGLPDPSPTTISTGSSGEFNGVLITAPSNAELMVYTISATAEKTPGYKAASASTSLTVTCPTYGIDANQCGSAATPNGTAVSSLGALTGIALTAVAYGLNPDDPCVEKTIARRKAEEKINYWKSQLAEHTNKRKALEVYWNSYSLWAKSGAIKTWHGVKFVASGALTVVGGAPGELAHIYDAGDTLLDVSKEGLPGVIPDIMKEPEEPAKVLDDIHNMNALIRGDNEKLEEASQELDAAAWAEELCHDTNPQYKSWYKKTYDKEPEKVKRFEPTPTPTPEQTGEATENAPPGKDETAADWISRKLQE